MTIGPVMRRCTAQRLSIITQGPVGVRFLQSCGRDDAAELGSDRLPARAEDQRRRRSNGLGGTASTVDRGGPTSAISTTCSLPVALSRNGMRSPLLRPSIATPSGLAAEISSSEAITWPG